MRMTAVLIGGAVCTCLQVAGSRGQIPLPPVPAWLPLSPAIFYPYAIGPLLVLAAIGENPRTYLGLGRLGAVPFTRAGLAVGIVLALGGWMLMSRTRSIPLLETALTLLCVEFFFRGFLLFPVARRLGWQAVPVAMLPYALVHAGKPAWELFGSIAFGLALGDLALRSRSALYGLGVHILLAAVGASWLAP
jgi:hypothetical protein